ncbi:hypothetical protein KAR91_05670 [Candidatus Pacearchaeota archaeon]|nr:hypothetical protein [Candidatus Pacearchaeota archaeon]
MKPKHILIGLLILQAGCSRHAYKPQRVEIRTHHTLILHASRVQMENAYEAANVKDTKRLFVKSRGEYTGFIVLSLNELHCFVPYPEDCMLHEYKHLGVKYGLVVPDDLHFNK